MESIGYVLIFLFAIAGVDSEAITERPGELLDYARSDDNSSYVIDASTCRFVYDENWYSAVKWCQDLEKQLLCFKSKKEVDKIVGALPVILFAGFKREVWFYNRDCSTTQPENFLSATVTKPKDTNVISYTFSTTGYYDKKCFICCSNVFGPCTNACKNGGACSLKENKPVCRCPYGYSGEFCEITPCDNYSCEHGGTCTNQFNNARCNCVSPYSGNHCETDPCTYHSCSNGGTCSFEGETAVCDCVKPYSGENCEIDPCTDYACLNEGYCSYKNEDFKPICQCYRPYFGERCEKDPCTDNPCRNGGICKVKYNKAQCECLKPYTGDFCETDSRYVGIMSLLGVLIGIVLLLLICGSCCMNKIIETLRLTLHNSGANRLQNLRP